MSPDKPEYDERAEYISGLRQLADFLEAHEDVPVPSGTDALHHVFADTDEAARAEVDRIASLIGQPAEARISADHYETVIRFGQFGPVRYTALAITRAHMGEYRAQNRAERESGGQA